MRELRFPWGLFNGPGEGGSAAHTRLRAVGLCVVCSTRRSAPSRRLCAGPRDARPVRIEFS
jgi:hypothetical protein